MTFEYCTEFMHLTIIFLNSAILLLTALVAARKINHLKEELKLRQTQEINQSTYRFAEMGRLNAELIHDLANPVTAVLFSLDEIETKHGPGTVSRARENVRYINDCLNSARLHLKAQKQKQFFCARSESMRVIGFLDQKATRANVGITAQLSELKLYGDNSKFGQVVSNLLDNAIDSYDDPHAGSNRNVKVDLKLSSDNTVILSVGDSGSGISSAQLNKIFEPFFSTKAGDKGTGLGLAISKRIVEDDFNGRLRVVSSRQSGTVFFVELPLGL
jgi:signal transduction histidine kinase